jgi:hypothetical protein
MKRPWLRRTPTCGAALRNFTQEPILCTKPPHPDTELHEHHSDQNAVGWRALTSGGNSIEWAKMGGPSR